MVEGSRVTIEGRVYRETEHEAYGDRVYVAVERAAEQGGVYVGVERQHAGRGDWWRSFQAGR